MAPRTTVEQSGESVIGDGSHRLLPTPFLTKTYQLVEDSSVDDVISWNEDGSTFIVWKPAEFARDLLPKYFKHNNFSSFVRQLNTYGFRKIVPDRWEFANDCFKKGEKRLLCDIHRRKISGVTTPMAIPLTQTGSPSNSGDEQVLSSNSSPPVTVSPITVHRTSTSSSCPADLVEENKRLRRENQHLTHELSQMKSLCNNIYVLMTKYANSRDVNCEYLTEKPLDLMPLRRGERVAVDVTTPRLFGVPIGTKRCRSEEGVDDQGEQQQGEAVKSEPLDINYNGQDSGWLI